MRLVNKTHTQTVFKLPDGMVFTTRNRHVIRLNKHNTRFDSARATAFFCHASPHYQPFPLENTATTTAASC